MTLTHEVLKFIICNDEIRYNAEKAEQSRYTPEFEQASHAHLQMDWRMIEMKIRFTKEVARFWSVVVSIELVHHFAKSLEFK